MGWFTRNGLHLGLLTALLSSVLFLPAQASASDASGLQRLSEDELRRVAAQGFDDRFLQRLGLYVTNGLAVEVLGNMATLINPVGEAFAGLLDADITFRDAIYNPINPATIINSDGSVLVRLPTTIGELNIRNLRIRGANGASFGSVTIRGLDLGGTTIRVTQR